MSDIYYYGPHVPTDEQIEEALQTLLDKYKDNSMSVNQADLAHGFREGIKFMLTQTKAKTP